MNIKEFWWGLAVLVCAALFWYEDHDQSAQIGWIFLLIGCWVAAAKASRS